MTTSLVDGNVLIALTVTDHVPCDVVTHWFLARQPVEATCPITDASFASNCSTPDTAFAP